MKTDAYKELLLRKRSEILSEESENPLHTSIESNTRQGDLADRASGNNEVHIKLKLKQTDDKILQAIEEALLRIDNDNYGICQDCGDQVASSRLDAIPWTRLCITCKEEQSA